MRTRLSRPSPAMVVALLALFFALAGTGYAAATAPTGPAGGDLTGSYPNPTIKAAAVTAAKVASNALTGAQIDESTLGRVPDADKLDGIDSTALTQGAASIYHESFDVKPASDASEPGPPITIPNVGQFTFGCSNSTQSGVGFGISYKNTTGSNHKVFVDIISAGSAEDEHIDDTAPEHSSQDLVGFGVTGHYTVQVLAGTHLVNLTGIVLVGAGCRNAAQATVTN